jgi:hypothetical protein
MLKHLTLAVLVETELLTYCELGHQKLVQVVVEVVVIQEVQVALVVVVLVVHLIMLVVMLLQTQVVVVVAEMLQVQQRAETDQVVLSLFATKSHQVYRRL